MATPAPPSNLPGISNSSRRPETTTIHTSTATTIATLNPTTKPPSSILLIQSTMTNGDTAEDSYSPRPEELKPMGNLMNARLYSRGGSNSVQVAQRASGLGARSSTNTTKTMKSQNKGGGRNNQPWGAYPSNDLSRNNSSFIAHRPSPSKKSIMASGSLYTKRSGRRLRTTQTKQSVPGSASPPPPPQTDAVNYNGLDVPYGMSDSNPNIALEDYRYQNTSGTTEEYEIKYKEKEDVKSTGTITDHQHTRKSITRGDLLRQAQHFKTFMEIMEEHPLYEMPYGDSFLYLKR